LNNICQETAKDKFIEKGKKSRKEPAFVSADNFFARVLGEKSSG
jgi:hypothetical protein